MSANRVEDALRESQERLNSIIASAMDAIITVDDQQRIVLFNASAERMFRCPAAEALGQPIGRFIPERFRTAHAAHIGRFGETGVTNRAKGALGAVQALRADGEEFQIEASISQGESGGKKLFTVILRDVTDRTKAEESLRKSEERFGKAFRSSPLATTISTELGGRYLDVNDAFLQMLGYKRGEVIGRTAAELGFWVQLIQRKVMLQHLRENGMVTGFRTQYKTSKGEIREAELSAELTELEGQPCVLTITRDITEMFRLEAQFRQAQRMEAVGRLAGGVAHDFNNILGIIVGYCGLAINRVDPGSPVKGYLEEISEASKRAVSITRQLLAFSRQQVVFPKLLDLNEVVDGVAKMLRQVVGEDISVSFRPMKQISSIFADPGQIEQILMNLAVNARDAMPTGGKINIETGHAQLDEYYVSQHPGSHAGQHVLLSVSDTGCGMDESTKVKIFEPFFTTKGIGQGTGLGLSTVYGIVKQGGGTIFVYSEPGKGTTFKIYFPEAAGTPEHLEYSEVKREYPAGSGTILVVEDDESLRKLVASILQGAGYKIIGARDAETALRILQVDQPVIDLLLTDVILPGKSGPELVERAKSLQPSLRSLFMSGYAGDLVILRGGLKPQTEFLEKPFTESSLLMKVRSALKG